MNYIVSKNTTEMYAVVADTVEEAKQQVLSGKAELINVNDAMSIRIQKTPPQPGQVGNTPTPA